MEFVIVRFPTERQVLINDQASGKTNETLMVQRGHQMFSLAGDKDFTPEEQEVVVKNTTAQDPLIVAFDLKPVDVAAPTDGDDL